MGNIILPAPGDLVDRQTILQVKLKHCGKESDTGYAPMAVQFEENNTPQKIVSRTVLMDKTEIDIQPFIIEHEAIQERLRRDWFPKLTIKQVEEDIFDTLLASLLVINTELWELENQARILRHAPERHSDTVLRRKAETLDAITFNNDQRAQVVKRINALWNIDVQEKIYV